MKKVMISMVAALLVVMLPSLVLSGDNVRKVEKSFDLNKGGNLEVEVEV